MSEPSGVGPTIPIRGKYLGDSAFREATKDLREWSENVKANVDVAKQSVAGFKETIEFARQALGGFGAGALARDIAGLAQDIYGAARGFAQFFDDARKAGVLVNDETIAAAHGLTKELDELKKSAMGVGVALAEPFIDELTKATKFLDEWLDGLRIKLEHGRKTIEQSAGEGARGAIGNVTLPSWMNKSPEADRGNFESGDLNEKDFGGFALIEAKRQREIDEERRKREAEDRERLREQTAHDEKIQREMQRQQQEDQRRALRAQQIMVEFDTNELDKMAQVDYWAQQQLALVKGHEDAEMAIRQEAEVRKANLLQAFRDRETKERINHHIKNLQNQAAALNAAQGLAQAAGIKSHGLQKAMAIGQAIIQFNLAKAKAIGEGGPLAGPALVAAVIGMMTPIIGALKGSSPGGGSEFSGNFSVPSLPTAGGSPSFPTASPQAPIVQAAPQNKIEVSLMFKGSLLTEEKIQQGVMDAIEIASRDGRTSIVTRKD